MPDAIKALAKAAVTALLKADPSALAIAGGAEAVGWLIDRFSGREKSAYDRLIATVTGQLERLPAHEFGTPVRKAAALANATTLFEAHGLSASDLVELNLEPERATQELLRRGATMLGTAGEPVAELVRKQIVPAIYRGLLQDPEHLETLKPAIFQSLLAQRELIRELPEEVGAALRRMLGRHLLWHPGRLWPRGRRDLSILRAEYGVVGFHPQRDDWLKQILGWCESDRRIAIRLITGPGGTGKTRLMLEVCDRLPRSWRAGFLHPETPAVPSWELDGLIDGEQPLLLVVDYAEEERKRTALGAILKYLRLHGTGHPVRLMLLTREESDWWPELAGSDAEVHDLVSEFPPTVDELPPLAEGIEQRQEALRAAARAYARALDVPEPDVAQRGRGGRLPRAGAVPAPGRAGGDRGRVPARRAGPPELGDRTRKALLAEGSRGFRAGAGDRYRRDPPGPGACDPGRRRGQGRGRTAPATRPVARGCRDQRPQARGRAPAPALSRSALSRAPAPRRRGRAPGRSGAYKRA